MVDKDSLVYRSGDLFATKKIRAFLETFIYGSYDGTFYLTYWSVMHLLSGVLVALIFKKWDITDYPYWAGFAIHTLWELWQVFIRMSNPFKLTGHNNIVDTLMDTLLFMLGMWVVYRGQ